MSPDPTADIRLQREDFDVNAEIAKLTTKNGDVGAVVTFSGVCRDEAGTLSGLELEHYPAMAEEEIGRIAAEAFARWPVIGLTVIHRYGMIKPGGNIVLVAAASAHRQAAFAAADFLMDFLKSKAPFWKKEHLADGAQGGWVDARETDAEALDRWTATARSSGKTVP